MRVVVADATPLHYLILIDAVFVIPRLFEKIHVPIEARDELICDATPTLSDLGAAMLRPYKGMDAAVRTWFRKGDRE